MSLAITEENKVAFWGGYFCLIAFSWDDLSSKTRLAWAFVSGLACYSIGPGSLPLLAAVVLFSSNRVQQATLALLISVLLIPAYTTTLASTSILTLPGANVPIGSTIFLIVGSISTFAYLLSKNRTKDFFRAVSVTTLIWIALYYSLDQGRLEADILTASWFRWAIGIPLVLSINGITDDRENLPCLISLKYLILTIMVASALSIYFLTLYKETTSTIVFDETHGDWESTKTSYSPDDFGRNVTYTYRALFEYVSSLEKKALRYEGGEFPAPKNTLFILKMPTKPLDDSFASGIEKWTEEGGSLLIVADHTNLFDTTTNLSRLLQKSETVSVAHTANFDQAGKPAQSDLGLGGVILGQFVGTIDKFNYLTGATFDHISYGTAVLGRYGQSFSEDAIYYRPNRFGTFSPSVNIPFGNHASLVAYQKGKGTIYVLLDSTPWSNFSMFKAEYQDLFRMLTGVSEFKNYASSIAFCTYAATFCLLLMLLVKQFNLAVFSSLFLAVFWIVSNLWVGLNIYYQQKNEINSRIHAFVGHEAKAEFLPQMIPIGVQNFSRSIASLQKYANPTRLAASNMNSFEKSVPSNLLIYPETTNLPSPEDCLRYIDSGGRIVILWSSHHAKIEKLKKWLDSLSLHIQPTKALAFSENPAFFLEDRIGTSVSRHQGFRVSALSNSHLVERDSSDVWQIFELRDQELDLEKTSGALVISFSGDQFSDSAIGDVWDGTVPSFLTVIRESQLASALLGKNFEKSIDDVVWIKSLDQQNTNRPLTLSNYAVTKDGAKLFSGNFGKNIEKVEGSGLGNQSRSYLASLQSDAVQFFHKKCEIKEENSACKKHFISADNIEWQIIFSKRGADLQALELIHDQKFSGSSASYNILFFR